MDRRIEIDSRYLVVRKEYQTREIQETTTPTTVVMYMYIYLTFSGIEINQLQEEGGNNSVTGSQIMNQLSLFVPRSEYHRSYNRFTQTDNKEVA